ncbi:hypothetical protein Tco_0043951, partial [Tanacetum coccineum]
MINYSNSVISAATDEVPTDMEVTTAGVSVSTAEPVTIASAPVTTAGVSVTTAEPSTPLTTTTTVFEDEDLTIAQTLVKMKSDKSKEKGLFMKEPSETSTRPTVPIQQLDPKDKDYELAARLQEQEQEELTIEQKSRLFVELMDKRKKHFAKLRAEEQRRKPPTKAQKRNQMCTYLKNMVGFTHSQLKNKSFDEVYKDFDKTMREDLEQESTKKQKMDDDKKKEEFKQYFEIVPDDGDDVTIEATP